MPPTAAGPGDASVLARSFERADQRYGPVPIWWWSGERLEQARLRWQMEQLCAQGVTQAVVPDGEVKVGRPEYLARACEASLRALGTDVNGLYQLHEPDPAVPFEESIGALADLRAAGKIRQIGISNAGVDLIRRPLAVTPLASVQNRLGPGHRYGAAELALCEQHGLAFLAYSPLGGLAAGDQFAQVAAQYQVSPHRVALAWELSLSPAVIPIPGATRPETILDSVQAAALTLSPTDRRLLGGVTDRKEFDEPQPLQPAV